MKDFKYFLSVLFIHFSVVGFAQTHFVADFSVNALDHMNINIISATIGGAGLEAGDEIAVFDGRICCGITVLSGPVTLAAIDASQKYEGSNGYTIGHVITYKFWDKSEGKERAGIIAEYLDPNTAISITAPTFSANESAIVKLSVSAAANQAPVANAGTDQAVNEGSFVTLDGSAANDPDLNPLTYIWTAPSGITISSTTASKPTFTAPEVTVNTDYTFSLLVNDGTVNSQADEVVITVKNALVANAGADQSVNKGVTVTLDGSASSDPNGKTLTYKWTSPEGIMLSSTTAAKPTFTAPEVSVNTDYTFSLVVNNGTVDSPADQVVVSFVANSQGHFVVAFSGYGQDQMTINAVTATIDGIPLEAGDEVAAFDGTICCGKIVLSQSINFNDDHTSAAIVTSRKDAGLSNGFTVGNPINYKFWDKSEGKERSGVTAEYLDRNTTLPTSALTYSSNESAIVKLSVSSAINHAPVASSGVDQSVNEGTKITLDGSGSTDADGNQLTYKWTAPAGIILDSKTISKPTFTAPEVTVNTNYIFSLLVNDGIVNSTADEVVIMVKSALVANAGTDQSVNKGVIVTLDGSASSDPEGKTLTYKWTSPAGITLSSSAVAKPSFTAPDVSVNTDYTFSLVVNNGTVDSPADQVVASVIANSQGHFVVAFSGYGQDQMTINAVTAMIDGAPLEAGDEIAAFDGAICCGKIILSQSIIYNDFNTSAAIVTSRKDAGLSNGFTVGNPITYKFWDKSEGKERSGVKAEYVDRNNGLSTTVPVYSANESAIVKLSASTVPVSNAGVDRSVDEGATVTLDGSLSRDADGNTLTYKWTAPDGITLSSTTVAKPTITAPEVTADQVYIISLVVNNGTIDSPADKVTITVKNVDHAPDVKSSIQDVSVEKGAADRLIDLKTVFTDSDVNDVLSFAVTSNSNNQVVNAIISNSVLTLNFSITNTGTSDVVITATSKGKDVQSKFKVEVKLSTGIDALIDDENIQVYPNPTNGVLHLKFNKPPKTGTCITVFDLAGKMISESEANKMEECITLSGNTAGIYIIQINHNAPKTYKIILK
jgi:hypothetical protein